MLQSRIHRIQISPDFLEKSVSATTPPPSRLEMLSAAQRVTRIYKPYSLQVTVVPFLLAVCSKAFLHVCNRLNSITTLQMIHVCQNQLPFQHI